MAKEVSTPEVKIVEMSSISVFTGQHDSALRALESVKDVYTSQPVRDSIGKLVEFLGKGWVKSVLDTGKAENFIIIFTNDHVGGQFQSQVPGDSKVHKISLKDLAELIINTNQMCNLYARNKVLTSIVKTAPVTEDIPSEVQAFLDASKKDVKEPTEEPTEEKTEEPTE